MNKQTIEQAAAKSSEGQIFFGTYQEGFIAGAEFALPKWIPVSEDIPVYTKALVYATTRLVFTDSFFDGKFDKAAHYCYTITHYIPLSSLPNP